MNNKVRVRYAPSPTGYLHIGGARSALFNYLYAKKYNGDFVFRIEDTDIERNIEGAEASQLHDLIWLGIIPDESTENPNPKYGKYRQTEKLDIYNEYARKLIDLGYAYECYCTSEELDAMKEEQLARGIKAFKYDRRCLDLNKEQIQKFKDEGRKPSIRIKMPKNHILKFNDLVRGEVTFNSDDIGDFVIIKSNGIPTYNFAVVIDDHIMEITHILRGEEHLSNTPKQLQVYEYFGWEAPLFGHMTIIVNENGKKLSKRDLNILQFMSQYKELGYLPEAVFNFLYSLGYTGTSNQEIFDKEEAIASFDPQRLSTSPAMFDPKKLLWINNQYIKGLSNEAYFALVNPFLEKIRKEKIIDEEKLNKLALILKNEISIGSEIVSMVEDVLIKKTSLGEDELKVLNEESAPTVINLFKNKFESLDAITPESIKNIFNEIKTETGLKGKQIFMPIRIKLTGVMHGIELFNIVDILGKEEIIKRL
ncbi:MAG TPA: glutamate--tRNA ligase [Candidatus Onthovivens sp.]|nr:glutamate--tRNA ligase [Candidatus Onthovivens sp.]